MIETLMTIVGAASLMNGVRRFDPYIDLVYWGLNRIFGCRISRFRDFLVKLLTCEDCLTFWTILILTLNPLYAGMGWVISNWISKKVDNLWIG